MTSIINIVDIWYIRENNNKKTNCLSKQFVFLFVLLNFKASKGLIFLCFLRYICTISIIYTKVGMRGVFF